MTINTDSISTVFDDDLDHPHHRIQLSGARFFKSDPNTFLSGDDDTHWVRMGGTVYNVDRDSHTTIAASMITRPKSVPPKSNGGDPRPHDHEILFYNLPDLTNPIARCGSDVWEKDKKTGTQAQPWHHPFTDELVQVAQIVGIKHYPETIVSDNMRVVIVIAFGRRPSVNNATDSHTLGVWQMLKVIEVWVPAHPQPILTKSMMNNACADPSLDNMHSRKCVRINPDDVINFETIETRQGHIMMRGRNVKLYSANDPLVAGGLKKVDCIAIFGIQNSVDASVMVIKKILFRDGPDHADLGKKTCHNKAVSRGVVSMALFPDYSGYEHLLVLFNKNGRGMVWDWVQDKQITQLHIPVDSNKEDSSPKRLYYWGVRVSAAFEDLNTPAFRVVAMATGTGKEDNAWGSCWWIIATDVLQAPMVPLQAPPIIDRTKSNSNTPKPEIHILTVIGKRFEEVTYGVCLPEQEKTHAEEHNKPIQFIDYDIWNHYSICLSSRMGLCIVDLEENRSAPVDRQWITFLKDREDLIGFDIIDHNLIIALKTGYLVCFDGLKHCKGEK